MKELSSGVILYCGIASTAGHFATRLTVFQSLFQLTHICFQLRNVGPLPLTATLLILSNA